MFRVGPTTYSLRIKDGPIRLDGVECLGLCDGEKRIIFISPRVMPDKRLGILIHELAHAWAFEMGEPAGAEPISDFCSTVAIACIRDLTTAGGEDALRRLRRGESLYPMKSKIGLLRARYCQCGGLVAPGEIHCNPDESNPGQIKFHMYCEHCDQTTIWNETMSFGGAPTGEVIGEPYVSRGSWVPTT